MRFSWLSMFMSRGLGDRWGLNINCFVFVVLGFGSGKIIVVVLLCFVLCVCGLSV